MSGIHTSEIKDGHMGSAYISILHNGNLQQMSIIYERVDLKTVFEWNTYFLKGWSNFAVDISTFLTINFSITQPFITPNFRPVIQKISTDQERN
mgnify:CR=1 FL=1